MLSHPKLTISGMFAVILFIAVPAAAQVRISGRVYDMSQKYPLPYVSVLSSSGAGTLTDSVGHYSLVVPESDSIWFSYLGKPTGKYSVRSIANIFNFEVALHVMPVELKEIRVRPRDYRQDSAQNREDYAKGFNYKKPGFDVSVQPQGGVGLDLDAFINMFSFQRNRRMVAFRNRLVREEDEKFVDHRFSRALVIKLTHLKGAELDTFMVHYRPRSEFAHTATDYELQDYIKKSYANFMQLKRIMGEGKKENE